MPIPLQPGHRAPKIALPSTENRQISVDEFKGKKNVVLFFYPEDDTPGCTREACGFRDSMGTFDANDTVVLGISTQSVESHMKFKTEHRLPFTLLSDEDAVMCRWFGVFDDQAQEALRVTFVIGKDGLIKKVFDNPDAHRHPIDAAEALNNA